MVAINAWFTIKGTPMKMCRVAEDPHYYTFDPRWYNSNGLTYQEANTWFALAITDKCKTNTYPPFAVFGMYQRAPSLYNHPGITLASRVKVIFYLRYLS